MPVADPIEAARNVDAGIKRAVEEALTKDLAQSREEGMEPKGYHRQPQEQVAEAVYAIRAGSIHSDSTFHLLRAQEQQLTATEEELRRKAQVIIDEHKDCQRALSIVRRLMTELTS